LNQLSEKSPVVRRLLQLCGYFPAPPIAWLPAFSRHYCLLCWFTNQTRRTQTFSTRPIRAFRRLPLRRARYLQLSIRVLLPTRLQLHAWFLSKTSRSPRRNPPPRW
jgi:hypothetical protein